MPERYYGGFVLALTSPYIDYNVAAIIRIPGEAFADVSVYHSQRVHDK